MNTISRARVAIAAALLAAVSLTTVGAIAGGVATSSSARSDHWPV